MGIVPTEKTVELLPLQAQTERFQAALTPKIELQNTKQKSAKNEIITAYYHATYN